jgi:hypothetical protein
VRSYLPLTIKKTELVLAGKSKTQMADSIKAALGKKELPPLEPGAMCYMLSKQGYLSDQTGRWHPHVMFIVPLSGPDAWGAGTSDSPVIVAKDELDGLTVLLIPVRRWSDGTADTTDDPR